MSEEEAISAIERACSVYCSGALLQAVQDGHIFEDSKKFVDMPMRAEPEDVIDAFRKLPQPPSEADLVKFLNENFESEGSDLVTWQPPDYSPNPARLQAIKHPTLRRWALQLNEDWHLLGRQQVKHVTQAPQRHSLIPLPFPLVVPGG